LNSLSAAWGGKGEKARGKKERGREEEKEREIVNSHPVLLPSWPRRPL
jgi:hypothetical protein